MWKPQTGWWFRYQLISILVASNCPQSLLLVQFRHQLHQVKHSLWTHKQVQGQLGQRKRQRPTYFGTKLWLPIGGQILPPSKTPLAQLCKWIVTNRHDQILCAGCNQPETAKSNKLRVNMRSFECHRASTQNLIVPPRDKRPLQAMSCYLG